MQLRVVIAVAVVLVAACAPSPTASGRFLSEPTASLSAAVPVASAVTPLDIDATQLALSGLDASTAAPYVAAAAADPWVLETVAGHRAEPVEVVDPGDGKTDISVSIYDYTASKLLRVWFGAGGTTITDRKVDSGQPGFSPREVARAREMVLASDKLMAAAGGVAYQVQAVKGAFPEAFDGHRVVAIVLAPASGASDRPLIAYADLSATQVVRVEGTAGY
jgi:hypothetical protein